MKSNKFKTNLLSLVIKHSLISTSIIGTVAILSMPVFANTTTVQNVQIQSSSLAHVINQFAQHSGILLNYDAKLVEGKRSTGLKGNYSIETGFATLLSPHGLQLQKTSAGYTIIANAKPLARDMGQLQTIDVIANAAAAQNNTGDAMQLPLITVYAEKDGSAKDGYLVKNITGAGIWGERSLQDTPYSMTVIPQELIENVQANDMAQIFKMNPLTQDGGDNSSGNYYSVIRGFSSNNAVINGMPLANWYSFTTTEDLERVETISGATGFLYGGGRVGGAINYVTKKPTLEDQKNIKIGNYGGSQYYGHIDLSGQIDQNNIFGYRVNALYQDGESVADVGKEQKFASITLDYKPTDNLYVDLNYAHREQFRNNMKLMFFVPTGTRPKLDSSRNYAPDWSATDEKNDRVMSNLKWTINDIFTLRSSVLYEESNRKIIGYTHVNTRQDNLYNVTNQKWPDEGQKFENWSGSVYLDSQFETLGVDHLLTIGMSENYYKYYAQGSSISESLQGLTLEQIKNIAIPSNPVPHKDRLPNAKTQYKNILIGDDITFNDQWSSLIGLNYATTIQTNYTNGVKRPAYDKSAVTPTLSLMYKPLENLTTYATYIESLEQGTIVGDSYSNAGEILDPLISKQYEVGAKYTFNDNLLITGALFRIEKANQYSDLATPTPKYVQDGEQIHQGLELTFTGKITESLTLMGGGTWMDLAVEKSNNPALEGKKPTNAAAKMAKIYAEYAVPELEGLILSGGAYYTGEKYGNALNTDEIPAYTLFDVGARYNTLIAQHPTIFNLTVSNVTGKNYWANSYYLGDPRTVAFSIKTQF